MLTCKQLTWILVDKDYVCLNNYFEEDVIVAFTNSSYQMKKKLENVKLPTFPKGSRETQI